MLEKENGLVPGSSYRAFLLDEDLFGDVFEVLRADLLADLLADVFDVLFADFFEEEGLDFVFIVTVTASSASAFSSAFAFSFPSSNSD